MKSNITRIFLVALLSLPLLTACNNYLDVKPYGRTIPKTAEEFAALLNSRLKNIDEGSDDYVVGSAYQNAIWDATCGDNFETCLNTNTGLGFDTYIGNIVGSIKADNYYRGLYQFIRDCNIVIGEMKESGEAADKIRATAYCMRGVAYYQLLRLYCEAPVPGQFDSQQGLPLVEEFDVEATPVRSTMGQTVSFIESDFEKAASYHMTDDVNRFTEDVAKGYLTRLYFWTGQWDKALTAAQEMLKKYPLLKGEAYRNMVTEPYELTGNRVLKSYRTGSGDPFTTTYSKLNAIPVSKRFLDAFSDEEKTTDVRYALDVNKKRVAIKTFFCGMRGAEFKLIEAECYYHLGQADEALKSINELRAARITDYKDLTQSTLPAVQANETIKQDAEGKSLTPLIALILRERRKELFLEGDRFFELKRNGAPEFGTIYNSLWYQTKKYMYTFPIPIHDIDLNSALVQNPGYTDIAN